ncbi:TetR/AcrR family transcriptional regulator [Nonomuraea pusilla]|uniref:Transcriptional regulator, TetR family n=1 Tax=Nonomuraea pusilla TaxID=46177 RepID=A0A1H7IWE1_9ACTN|nr:TetR/AcrR family transcriptional regulator [Nonomuraea pusilla]SEK65125.1 transcriptional regulator, TetR family [Nonomuraea pusilla]
MSASPARNQRADARRSRAAILDAAVRLLDADPDVSVEAIAAEAGVTRQTVYAHFPTRERLLSAVVERITEQAVAAMDAADPDDGPAARALPRVLRAASRVAGRHPALMARIAALPVTPQADRDLHAPVAERLERVIRRGQDSGEFDATLPPGWLVTVTIRLGHAASEAVSAGLVGREEAERALHVTLLRALGASDPASGLPPTR